MENRPRYRQKWTVMVVRKLEGIPEFLNFRYYTFLSSIIYEIFISRAWWLMPVIPAYWENESDRSPEVRRWRPSWPTW